MQVVPFYASLLALLFFVLSFRTIRLRQRLQIGVGDAGNPQLLRAMRVHSNFAEYVPLCLLLFCFVEMRGAPLWLVHGLGMGLLIGRLLHAFGVSQVKEKLKFRITGMLMTFIALLTASAYLLVASL